MMKVEFEELVNEHFTDEEYKIIETCYMTFDSLFPDKQVLVDFYTRNGIDTFRRLYEDAVLSDQGTNLAIISELKDYINSLESAISGYVFRIDLILQALRK